MGYDLAVIGSGAAAFAAPLIPPVPGLEEAGYLTSATAMELTGLPESVMVIGGNAVGLELGQLFARLGTRVTIVEALGRIAPPSMNRRSRRPSRASSIARAWALPPERRSRACGETAGVVRYS